jgi:hypothetical protein
LWCYMQLMTSWICFFSLNNRFQML